MKWVQKALLLFCVAVLQFGCAGQTSDPRQGGLFSYNPEAYEQRAQERKERLAAIEQAGQAGHGRVQRILTPAGQCCGRVEQRRCQRRFGQCNTARRLARTATTNGAIQVIAGVVVSHHSIGIVVGTIEEHADQGFVIGRIKRGGFANGGQVESHWQSGAAQCKLGTAAQEGAAARVVRLEQVHGWPYF